MPAPRPRHTSKPADDGEGGRAPWRAPPSHHFPSTHQPPGHAPPSHRICAAHIQGRALPSLGGRAKRARLFLEFYTQKGKKAKNGRAKRASGEKSGAPPHQRCGSADVWPGGAPPHPIMLLGEVC
eukprot:gene24086-biopygen1323